MISLIAAMTEDRVIGRDNQLLWHIPEDMKRFREKTRGHPVIMGRKTYESIGRLLPERANIIITRDTDYEIDGAVVVHSLDEAIERAKQAPGSSEIFIIGGGQIFSQAIDKAEKLYLTIVHKQIEGDAYFPEYGEFTKVLSETDSSGNGYSYTFLYLARE